MQFSQVQDLFTVRHRDQNFTDMSLDPVARSLSVGLNCTRLMSPSCIQDARVLTLDLLQYYTKFSTGLCRFETVSVPVAVIVAVDIAGAATPELRHPCRSPCPETRKRHEGESCPSGRDPPPSTRALVAHCWPPLLPIAAPCCLPLAACDAACAGCCGGRCRLRCRLRWLL